MDIPTAAVVVASFVGLISFLQYLTAREKIAIDLFDKRLKVFEDIEAAVADVMYRSKHDEAFARATNALIYSRFLFGQDVEQFIEKMREHVITQLSAKDFKGDDVDSAERSKRIDRQHAAMNALADFAKVSPTIFGPYMRVQHKIRPWWKFW